MSDALAAREAALAALDDRERFALDYVRRSGERELGHDLSEGMYALFLRGSTCEEIRLHHRGAYQLGQIVHARVRDGWDRRRQEHDQRLLDQARANAARVGLEAVEYVSRRLAAIHRVDEERLARGLANADPTELADLKGGGTEYRGLIDLLLKLTGQDKTYRVKTDGPLAEPAAEYTAPATPAVTGDLSPAQAAAMLRILQEG